MVLRTNKHTYGRVISNPCEEETHIQNKLVNKIDAKSIQGLLKNLDAQAV